MTYSRREIRRMLLALRAEMLAYLQRGEEMTRFCERCLLPLPEGEFEAYDFCPWCSNSFGAMDPCSDPARRIVENELGDRTEIQCGECGSEYEQPARYPFKFCVICGAEFAAGDELVIVLPWVV